jgi:hypothetical protein
VSAILESARISELARRPIKRGEFEESDEKTEKPKVEFDDQEYERPAGRPRKSKNTEVTSITTKSSSIGRSMGTTKVASWSYDHAVSESTEICREYIRIFTRGHSHIRHHFVFR